MIKLPNITLVCIDCLHYKLSINAINKSVEGIEFGNVLFLSDKAFYSPKFKTIIIDKITSKEQYSLFMLTELNKYIKTDWCLVIQYDGYVINPGMWKKMFLRYDYIGAPWWYSSYNVGNGGFSLRSKKLMNSLDKLKTDSQFKRMAHPEDDFICRKSRYILEKKYQIKYAPEYIANIFSFEPNRNDAKFRNNSFGFHGLPNLILY